MGEVVDFEGRSKGCDYNVDDPEPEQVRGRAQRLVEAVVKRHAYDRESASEALDRLATSDSDLRRLLDMLSEIADDDFCT